jgi:hypothetical protein
MAQMAIQGQMVCPDCGGKGKQQRFLNGKPHVCHLCNGSGVLTPMGDFYRMEEYADTEILRRVSWWPTPQALAAVRGD